jgi:hypothetical protein
MVQNIHRVIESHYDKWSSLVEGSGKEVQRVGNLNVCRQEVRLHISTGTGGLL